jgi:glycosyltransferase involved in cell wall biosynthesis
VVYRFAAALRQARPDGMRFTFVLHRDMARRFREEFGFDVRVQGPLRRLSPDLFREGDLWHVLNPDSRSVPLRHPGLLVTIHDLRILTVKHDRRRRAYRDELQRWIDRAVALTAISEATRAATRREFRVPDVPFPVIYNGLDLPPEAAPAPDPAAPYLFAIGQFEAKKRFHLLVEMLAYLPGYRLLLAGNCATEYGQEVRALVERLRLGPRVQLLGAVDEARKWRLYRDAAALVFPSSLEGFGLPLLEAMAVGTPVFASDDPALLEVGGGQCVHFDSLEPERMARAVETGLALDHSARRQARIDHARSFSWQRAVSEYLALYRSLLA